MGSLCTAKASNFGPHGNFGPLFQKSLVSLKRVLQKNERNKSYRKDSDLQIRFCSFLVHDSPKEATELAKKGPKLEAFTVQYVPYLLECQGSRVHIGHWKTIIWNKIHPYTYRQSLQLWTSYKLWNFSQNGLLTSKQVLQKKEEIEISR